MSQEHTLKTWPEFFRALWSGDKRFELRYDDRNFAMGDVLVLEEYNPHSRERSGRWIRAYVSYMVRAPGFDCDVLRDDDRTALGKGWVVMSIREVRRSRHQEGS